MWNTQLPQAIRRWDPAEAERIDDTDSAHGVWRGVVQLPPLGKAFLGREARLEFTVTGRGETPAPAVTEPLVAEPVADPVAEPVVAEPVAAGPEPEPRKKTRRRWLW